MGLSLISPEAPIFVVITQKKSPISTASKTELFFWYWYNGILITVGFGLRHDRYVDHEVILSLRDFVGLISRN